MKAIITLLFISLGAQLFAQPGTLDTTFNSIDVGYSIHGANDEVSAIAIQSDGKIIIGGWFLRYNDKSRFYIARLNSDATLDYSFNPGSGATGNVYTITLQGDGKIIIGGEFLSYNGTPRSCIARINSDGTLDNSFNPGAGANSTIYSTVLQNDGKIIIGGGFLSYNGTAINRIARLNSDGSLDNSFNTGTGVNGTVNKTCLQNDGKIIVVGAFTNYNGTTMNNIARLNPDGTLDNSFNLGTGANSTVFSTILQSDEKIIIGGNFTSYNGTAISRLARLNTDGSLDNGFSPGTGANSGIGAIAIQSDGKIIVGGSFYSYNSIIRNHIARINSDGSLDGTFDPGTGVGGSAVSAISVQISGKSIIGGNFTSYNGKACLRIALLNTDGSLDKMFNRATGADGWVWTTSLQNDGKIIISGYFTSYNDTIANRIARLNTNGTLDNTFNTGTGADSNIVTTSIQNDGKIIIGGYFTRYNGTTINRIARLNVDGTLDNSFVPGTGANNFVFATSLQSDGKIIIGGLFTSYNGTPINRIARLNADGSLDNSFSPGTGVSTIGVNSISIQSDGKIIIGGSFTSYNGTARNRVARLNTDGTLDISFDPGTGANSNVYKTSLQSDGKIIISGGFTSFNGTTRNFVARLSTDGTLDNTFTPTITSGNYVRPTVQQSDGKIIIGGDFVSISSTSRIRIGRLNTDGSLDNTFNPGTGSDSIIQTISLQSDEKIIIGGQFTRYNGKGRNYIARVYGTCTIDNLVSQSGETLTANASSANYQWIDCDNGNATIPGATNQSFTATTNGNYAAIITQGVCSDTSSCFSILSVNLSKLKNANNSISIYPNPSNGVITISPLGTGINSEVNIFNVLGQNVFSSVFNNHEMTFNPNLTKGLYWVNVKNDGNQWTKVLAIQ